MILPFYLVSIYLKFLDLVEIFRAKVSAYYYFIKLKPKESMQESVQEGLRQ